MELNVLIIHKNGSLLMHEETYLILQIKISIVFFINMWIKKSISRLFLNINYVK